MNRIVQWWTRRCVLRAREERAYAGRFGERLAARFLRRKAGLKVLLRNWRHGHGELDLIAYQGRDLLVFVEVRARKEEALVSGFQSLTRKKRESLKRTTRAYLKNLKRIPKSVRFDVVEVHFNADGTYDLNHFANVVL